MDDNARMPPNPAPGHASDAQRMLALEHGVAQSIRDAHGWLPFDAFMQQALYAPGLGYYASGSQQFGAWAADGSDFVTAPELSPLFGQVLAVQVAEALHATGTNEIWEFGAGSGALASQILQALAAMGATPRRYTIVDVSAALQARQRERLAAFGDRVRWASTLPDVLDGVVLGNEVLDAMPVKLLARTGNAWHERGVTLDRDGQHFAWADHPTPLRPPLQVEGTHDYVTEVHPQAEAFVRTIAERLARGNGAAFFIDYGFPEAEYYHWQRHMGTLACHHRHRMDDAPLLQVGAKDITTHINFTGIALAAQDAGLDVLGYTSQGRFLLNLGLAERMAAADLPERSRAMKLLAEHEMGELFKVIALAADDGWPARGFAAGDRTHRL